MQAVCRIKNVIRKAGSEDHHLTFLRGGNWVNCADAVRESMSLTIYRSSEADCFAEILHVVVSPLNRKRSDVTFFVCFVLHFDSMWEATAIMFVWLILPSRFKLSSSTPSSPILVRILGTVMITVVIVIKCSHRRQDHHRRLLHRFALSSYRLFKLSHFFFIV